MLTVVAGLALGAQLRGASPTNEPPPTGRALIHSWVPTETPGPWGANTIDSVAGGTIAFSPDDLWGNLTRDNADAPEFWFPKISDFPIKPKPTSKPPAVEAQKSIVDAFFDEIIFGSLTEAITEGCSGAIFSTVVGCFPVAGPVWAAATAARNHGTCALKDDVGCCEDKSDIMVALAENTVAVNGKNAIGKIGGPVLCTVGTYNNLNTIKDKCSTDEYMVRMKKKWKKEYGACSLYSKTPQDPHSVDSAVFLDAFNRMAMRTPGATNSAGYDGWLFDQLFHHGFCDKVSGSCGFYDSSTRRHHRLCTIRSRKARDAWRASWTAETIAPSRHDACTQRIGRLYLKWADGVRPQVRAHWGGATWGDSNARTSGLPPDFELEPGRGVKCGLHDTSPLDDASLGSGARYHGKGHTLFSCQQLCLADAGCGQVYGALGGHALKSGRVKRGWRAGQIYGATDTWKWTKEWPTVDPGGYDGSCWTCPAKRNGRGYGATLFQGVYDWRTRSVRPGAAGYSSGSWPKCADAECLAYWHRESDPAGPGQWTTAYREKHGFPGAGFFPRTVPVSPEDRRNKGEYAKYKNFQVWTRNQARREVRLKDSLPQLDAESAAMCEQ